MASPKDLRPIKRFITGHAPDGKEIFHDEVDEDAPFQPLPDGAEFALCYTTKGYPVELDGNRDIETYRTFLANPPGITVSDGSVLRVVNMMPGALSPMHRTISVDYGVVLEGEVELVLESGEKRVMKRGDVSVQRATNHAWRNTSATSWARMLYVLLPAAPVTVAGRTLGEDTTTIPGIRESD